MMVRLIIRAPLQRKKMKCKKSRERNKIHKVYLVSRSFDWLCIKHTLVFKFFFVTYSIFSVCIKGGNCYFRLLVFVNTSVQLADPLMLGVTWLWHQDVAQVTKHCAVPPVVIVVLVHKRHHYLPRTFRCTFLSS